MLFNSLNFAVFLPVVFLLYWWKRGTRFQNVLLLAASYFFYACWDWRFLFLLIFSTALDYFTGIKIAGAGSQNIKKIWLWTSIAVNLGFLGFFKYYNFFVASLAEMLAHTRLHVDPWTLSIILPVGISFYTFHGLSYVIDIYNGRVKPERSFGTYALFVSFFPLLVAGPIERATNLLPQLKSERKFDYANAVDGLRQILWGLFKKIVIADNCAALVNPIFGRAETLPGSTLALGAVLFAFQIYADFSGYSDVAIGTARLFGISVLKNFSFPYFARDIAEFWRRWHISLTSWFKDYVYIPLGGSKGSVWIKIRNTLIVFILSGFWHGAEWTFIIWGLLNALYFIPLLLTGRNRKNMEIVAKGKLFPSFLEFAGMIATFAMTTFAWIFFRSSDIASALAYVKNLFSKSLFTAPEFITVPLVALLLLFVVTEWLGREKHYALEKISLRWPTPLRWSLYVIMFITIFAFGGQSEAFIYFQF